MLALAYLFLLCIAFSSSETLRRRSSSSDGTSSNDAAGGALLMGGVNNEAISMFMEETWQGEQGRRRLAQSFPVEQWYFQPFQSFFDGPYVPSTTTVGSGQQGNYFGQRVVLGPNSALVTAHREYSNSTGAAYVYTMTVGSSFSLQQKLTNNLASDQLGLASIYRENTFVVLGAPFENTEAGAVYYYPYSTTTGKFSQLQKLVNPGTPASARFGFTLALPQTLSMFVVGAGNENSQVGAAYVYYLVSGLWTCAQRLVPTTGHVAANFGMNVGFSDSFLFVGEPAGGATPRWSATYVYVNTAASGSTPTFSLNQLMQAATTVAPVSSGWYYGIGFGYSSNFLAISASNDAITSTTDMGSLFVYPMVTGVNKFTLLQKLVNTGGNNGNNYNQWGSTIAMTNTVIVCGVPGYKGYNGGIYVFTYVASTGLFSMNQALGITGPFTNGQFGQSVAMSSSLLLVGAPQDSPYYQANTPYTSGIVVAYTIGSLVTYTQEQLTYDETGTSTGQKNLYGNSCLIGANSVVVGAYQEAAAVSNGGAVYVYSRSVAGGISALSKQQQLVPSPQTASNFFGWSLGWKENAFVIVGGYESPFAGAGTGSGAAWFFVYSSTTGSYSQQQVLINPSPAFGTNYVGGSRFGFQVAVPPTSNVIAISAGFESFSGGSNVGAVYVFSFASATSTWTASQRLSTGTSSSSRYFGMAMVMTDSFLIIGEPGLPAVYVFVTIAGSFTLQQVLTPPLYQAPAGNGASFGANIAISSQYLVIGASSDVSSSFPSDGGAIFVYPMATSIASKFSVQQKLKCELCGTTAKLLDEAFNALATQGSIIAGGNPLYASNIGAVYVWSAPLGTTTGTFTMQQKIVGGSGYTASTNMMFGASVTMRGTMMMVGAPQLSTYYCGNCGYPTTAAGAMYMYQTPLQCAPGSIGLSSGTSCTPCPLGTNSPTTTTNATSCSSCPTGKYSFGGGASCNAVCPAGSIIVPGAVAGTSACVFCQAGQYSDVSGLTSCKSCGVNMYSPASNSTTCFPCAVSTYSRLGSSSCSRSQAPTMSPTNPTLFPTPYPTKMAQQLRMHEYTTGYLIETHFASSKTCDYGKVLSTKKISLDECHLEYALSGPVYFKWTVRTSNAVVSKDKRAISKSFVTYTDQTCTVRALGDHHNHLSGHFHDGCDRSKGIGYTYSPI